ncbi:hypothetical protein N8841_03965 [Candidatus Pelagibacter sp.]|nr:hypothetical protein [Candidatus Pelagibacter sp.]
MSHLIKNNNIILKFLRIIFYILILSTIIITTYYYKGSKVNVIIFGLLSNLIFLFIFSKKSYFFEIFFGALLWLGFWYKFFMNVTFMNYQFLEGAGNFTSLGSDSKINVLDGTLNTAVFGIAGFLLACLIKNSFLNNFYNIIEIKKKQENFLDNKFFYFLFLIAIVLFFIIIFSNFFLGIYQRGILSSFKLHFVFSGIYKWLLLFGFTSFVAFSFILAFKNKSKTYMFSAISIIETFLTNISFLSRGMIFNLFAIFIGLYKSNKIFKLKLSLKFFLIYLFSILFFFYLSVVSVNYLRANIFFVKLDSEYTKQNNNSNEPAISEHNVIIQNKYNTPKKALLEFLSLTHTRWVGIDALIAVESYNPKSYDLFKQSFKDKFDKKKLPFYERKIQNRTKSLKNNTIQYGITTPGIFAFLYYTGSKFFVFLLTFVLSVLILTIERYIFIIFNNLILCSVLSQVLAYRLIHFGYMPQNTYLLLGTFMLTVAGLLIIKIIFLKR